MAYTPPAGGSIDLDFSPLTYTPPVGDSIDLDFDATSGSSYNETVAETLAALDAAGLFGELIETLLSSMGLVDSTIGGLGLHNTLAETYTALDVATGQISTSGQVAESILLQDTVASIAALLVADMLHCSDIITSLLNAISTIRDALSNADVSNSRVTTGDGILDSLSTNDAAISRIVTAALEAVEVLAIADTHSSTRATSAAVVDLFLLNLIINTAGPLDISVAELLSAADGYATHVVGANTTGEALHGGDVASSSAVVSNTLATLLQLTAVLAVNANLSVAIDDLVTSADEVASNAIARNIVAIDALLSDVSAIYGVGTNSLLSDMLFAAGAASTSMVSHNSVADIITILDTAELLFGLSPYDIINLILSLAKGYETTLHLERTVELGNITLDQTVELGNITLDQTTTRGVEL